MLYLALLWKLHDVCMVCALQITGFKPGLFLLLAGSIVFVAVIN